MKRFTNKYPDNTPVYYKYYLNGYHYEQGDFIEKLGQIEDIEEELGISAIILLKVLKDGCWLFSNHCHYTKYEICFLEYRSDLGCEINFEEKYFTIVEIPAQNEMDVHELYFSDYGKTWALTKEELISEESTERRKEYDK